MSLGGRTLPDEPMRFGLPADWLVVAPGSGQVLYRLLGADHPRLRDFLSDRDKGRPRPADASEIEHLGLSMFASEAQALSMARRFPKVVAEIVLEPGHGFSVARSMVRIAGHYSVWGVAQDLLGRVAFVQRHNS